jgi:K+-sensing histidine kinase KdpD
MVYMRWSFATVTCVGLLVALKNMIPNRALRRTNKYQRVDWSSLEEYHSAALTTKARLDEAADARVNEAIDSLHDVRTAVNLVTRNAEAIVMSLPGYSDDDKIENAPAELKSLLKSVRLLQTRLVMSSLLANPESASYGNKRSTPVYRVFDRMVRLFSEQAARKRVGIAMAGASYGQPPCFDSFETIPLVLIDNAIKYASEGTSIEVNVRDTPQGTSVFVRSHGPIVPEAERTRIFERGYRTAAAQSFAAAGAGLGLHLSKIVAAAHGFEISYSCSPAGSSLGYGHNLFSFVVAND